MSSVTPTMQSIRSLQELTELVQAAEGFSCVVDALKAGRSGAIDGCWGSTAALATAGLGRHAPATLLVVIAHPRDLEGWAEDLAGFSGCRPAIFPAWETLPTEHLTADETGGQRLRILKQLEARGAAANSSGRDGPGSPIVLTTIQALIQPVPDRETLRQNRRILSVGAAVGPEELATWLVAHRFKLADGSVVLPGTFNRRGGILDVFPIDAEAPFRLEFFGDEIESIRQFSPQTQRSLAETKQLELTAPPEPLISPSPSPSLARGEGIVSGHLCDYLPPDSWTLLVEPDELQEQAKHYHERVADGRGLFSLQGVLQQLLRFPSVLVSAFPLASAEVICHLRVESVERFSGNIANLSAELAGAAAGDRFIIACHNEAERHRLQEVLDHQRAGEPGASATGVKTPSPNGSNGAVHLPALHFDLVVGRVHAGFRFVEAGLIVLGDHELFQREEARQVMPRRRVESRAIDSFLDLNDGDLVVHVSHGIARYRGMNVIDKNDLREEHLILEFREGTLIYVPASKIDLVQKYVGGSRTEPELSKVGGVAWQRKKDKVQEAVLDLACEMVELQALRSAQPGIAFPPDTEWQKEFEASFQYQETPDQLTTAAEIRQDMERSRPMDRLVCGDVGYGKTELAIRAAFKSVDSGKQVAVLVPTTVLAEQHYRTFTQRLAEYPFVVESLSRFRSPAEQRDIVKRLSEGGIDIVVGTHRLVSNDVQFKDLGLVVIDEEQRFGVEHKERLKKLRQTVDVLTLTATPIPRTLHLSLLGIRDISNLETPPADRLAIETRIVRFDPTLIRHAILRERNREGQVYFVHNRVYNIHEIADKLRSIVPEARISVAHGQMAEGELEQAMLQFVRHESDILVATTIIESGLDIPNVNTIFINQADIYGLADLHQLRGRVGRYKHRAYAYLLLDSERSLTSTAARRLKAIEEFTELGAGFRIAVRDLEIRGAGNILGTQQSGHIAAVGYEMYCQLLDNAVRRMKNQPLRTHLEVTIDLPYSAYLPRDYVPDRRQRIEVYRRLSRIRRTDRLEDFRQELRDRFGKAPEPAEWLLRLAELRVLAARWQVATVHLEDGDVVLGYRSTRLVERLAKRSLGRLRIVNQHQAYFRLKRAESDPLPLFTTLRTLLRLPERKL